MSLFIDRATGQDVLILVDGKVVGVIGVSIRWEVGVVRLFFDAGRDVEFCRPEYLQKLRERKAAHAD